MFEFTREPEPCLQGLQYLLRGADDLGADAVPGEQKYLVSHAWVPAKKGRKNTVKALAIEPRNGRKAHVSAILPRPSQRPGAQRLDAFDGKLHSQKIGTDTVTLDFATAPVMNPGLELLQPYPFERLAALRKRCAPAAGETLINLSIGEPQHPTPAFVHEALINSLEATGKYPATRGLPELREVIAAWLSKRFDVPNSTLDPDRHVLPVNGTREALFAISQAVFSRDADKALIAMPNPFYQIYEGAALLAGARPYYLPCPAARDFRPDLATVPSAIWAQLALVYVCSPGNPSGAVMAAEDFELLLERADEHDFVVVADECYSELYADESRPPLGLLQWCAMTGRDDFSRCLVMHSLSKRSNAPGLRSGFVAGDAALIQDFFQYRTYQGGAMPIPVQHASIAAWSDETHVAHNRALYRAKFDSVIDVLQNCLEITRPEAGFYLWPQVPDDGVSVCERLLSEAAVLVLPGEFLARDSNGANPGRDRIRLALVAEHDHCLSAAHRIRAALAV